MIIIKTGIVVIMNSYHRRNSWRVMGGSVSNFFIVILYKVMQNAVEAQIKNLEKPIEDELLAMKTIIDELYKKLQGSIEFDYDKDRENIRELQQNTKNIENHIHGYKHDQYRVTFKDGKEKIYFLALESMKILTNLFSNNFNKAYVYGKLENDDEFKERLSKIYDKFTIDVENFSKKYENIVDKEFIKPYMDILYEVNEWFTNKFSINTKFQRSTRIEGGKPRSKRTRKNKNKNKKSKNTRRKSIRHRRRR